MLYGKPQFLIGLDILRPIGVLNFPVKPGAHIASICSIKIATQKDPENQRMRRLIRAAN